MPNQTQNQSHCVVQWEDKKNEYAVVDMRRAKTVSTLKVGSTTLFEGRDRNRRRGKILFMGNKKESTSFGLDLEEEQQDGRFNSYYWSGPPGLDELIEETTRNIREVTGSAIRRTASSSSTNSNKTNKQVKRKKISNKHHNKNDKSDENEVILMPPPPQQPSSSIITTISPVINTDDNNLSSSDVRTSSSSSVREQNPHAIAASMDTGNILQENKTLREKNLALQDELFNQKENSIPLPSEECYSYLKTICSTYEHIKSERNSNLLEIAKKLPCTSMELKLARKPNPSSTINNLVKICFKDIDLSNMSYEKLKMIDPMVLENIHEYVKCIHAPSIIAQSMFSSTISLKCRHLREVGKHKNIDSPTVAKNNRSKTTQSSDKHVDHADMVPWNEPTEEEENNDVL